jgi:hypothetical protein
MKSKSKKSNSKINWNIILYSFIAFGFLGLTYFVDWIFIVGAIIMIWLNQRELRKK